MENFEPQANKKQKPEGTNHWFRYNNPDGTVSSFETKEELDKHIEEAREKN